MEDDSSSLPTPTPTSQDTGTRRREKTDIAWRHVSLTINSSGKKEYKCLHCSQIYLGGGINRMKRHLAREKGDVGPCKYVPSDVQKEMQNSLNEIQSKKRQKTGSSSSQNNWFDLENEEEEEIHLHENTTPHGSSGSANSKESMKLFWKPPKFPAASATKQKDLKSCWTSKEAVDEAKLEVCKIFYDTCITFNAINSVHWMRAFEKAVKLGSAFQMPSFHELRTHFLKIAKQEMQLWVDSMRALWKEVGCTIMADGWTDIRQRTLINFLIYSPRGTIFFSSVDATAISKTGEALFDLFASVISWVGPKNVVHVVTDNAANYVKAGKLIEDFYKGITWTPCAAHCMNLILKDMGKLQCIDTIMEKAAACSRFVYNHTFLLNWLRHRDGWKEIVRPCATRFGTAFLALQSLHEHKHDLQALATSRDFTTSRYAKLLRGENFVEVVLDNRFWNDCSVIVGLMDPLMHLLRIVDGDRKPTIGYVYEGLRRAKRAIKDLFLGNQDKYKPFLDIIKRRWSTQLKKGLHVAAFWLNPAFQYDLKYSSKMRKLTREVVQVITTMGNGDRLVLLDEMTAFQERAGAFGDEITIEAARKKRPDHWWMLFGGDVPLLQEVAMKILSQTSSASGCERNWSVFERIHSKKRNRLEHQRLNDLVYVHYNMKLKERLSKSATANQYDPIDITLIDGNRMDDWILEGEEPFLEYEEIEEMLYSELEQPTPLTTTTNEKDFHEFQAGSSRSSIDPTRLNFSSFEDVELPYMEGDAFEV